ncbi:hypothetical protein OHA72_27230 [Dactylosporangium sp. NBC_01737]|uniref:hypothetical protein n=1 Tax=Dactylosporangium sp. NBC_01737 TaxID=2975959 RepID=UPI002E0F717F|nr:hypothetical protein OHA72_27230 [Dactylosporangium sp. NBC_01737]
MAADGGEPGAVRCDRDGRPQPVSFIVDARSAEFRTDSQPGHVFSDILETMASLLGISLTVD